MSGTAPLRRAPSFLAIRAALLVGFLLVGCSPAERAEDALHRNAQTLTELDVAPRLVDVRFEGWVNAVLTYRPAPRVESAVPIGYEIQRWKDFGAPTIVRRIACTGAPPEPCALPAGAVEGTLVDKTTLPFHADYFYQVRTVYAETAGGPCAREPECYSGWSNTFIVEQEGAEPWARRNYTMSVRLVRPSGVPEHMAVSDVEARFFDADLSNDLPSVNEYLQEITAGVDRTAADPAVRLSGTVEPWHELSATHAQIMAAAPGESYKAAYQRWIDAEHREEYSSWLETGYDWYVLVIDTGELDENGVSSLGANSGTIHDEGWAAPVHVGLGELQNIPAPVAYNIRSGVGAIAHEMLHTIRTIGHVAGLWCSGSFPMTFDQDAIGYRHSYSDRSPPNPCWWMSAGAPYDVMASKGDSVHPSAFHKYVLGLLPESALVWIDTTDEGEGDEPYFDLSEMGDWVDIDLYDHVTRSTSASADRLALIKLDVADTVLMLDYRQSLGTNLRTAVARGDETVYEPVPAGVHVALWAGSTVDWHSSRYQPVNYVVPLSSGGGRGQGVVLRPERPLLVDTRRCLTVRFRELAGTRARVRIERRCTYLPPDAVVGVQPPLWMEGGFAPGGSWSSHFGDLVFTSGQFPMSGTTINGVAAEGYANAPDEAGGYQSVEAQQALKFLHDGTGGTLAMVFQANADGDGGALINSVGKSAEHRTGLAVSVGRGGNLVLALGASSGTPLIRESVNLRSTVANPHFLIFRYRQGESPEWSLFLDDGATPIAEGNAVGTPDLGPSSFPVAIGGSFRPGAAFDGAIGEVYAVDAFATDEEVARLAGYFQEKFRIGAAAPTPPAQLFGDALQGWWRGEDAQEESWPAAHGEVDGHATIGELPVLGDILGHPAAGYLGPQGDEDGYVLSSNDLRFLHDGSGSTVAGVFQPNNSGATMHLFDNSRGGAATGFSLRLTASGKLVARVSSEDGLVANAVAPIDMSEPHYFVFRFQHLGGVYDWSMFVDQATIPVASGRTRVTPSAGPAGYEARLLSKSARETRPFDGMLGELLVARRFATDAEVEALGAYLVQRFELPSAAP